MKKTLEPYQLIERSIIKKYRKELWAPFIVAVKHYELVQAGDRIAVCISGGKDSMLMAKLMQELQRHSDVPFELVFLVMDPGYNEINRQKIESNAELLHIPVTIFESNIFAVANNTDKSPCYLCARMRRGHLYSKARELGCNKIALGHHFNDVIETTVMSMFYGSQLQAMPPKLHSTSFPGMTLIRPMYCIREEDILAWKHYNELEFIQCACRFTENCTMCDNGGGSKRQEVKTLLRRLKRENPNIENSIFRSIHAVALDTMPGYKSEGVEHSFLERFNEKRAGTSCRRLISFRGILSKLLKAYDAAKGGNVPKSYLHYETIKPVWRNKQIEADLSFVEVRRNSWKSIATLTTFMTEALKNQMFYDIFSMVDDTLSLVASRRSMHRVRSPLYRTWTLWLCI